MNPNQPNQGAGGAAGGAAAGLAAGAIPLLQQLVQQGQGGAARHQGGYKKLEPFSTGDPVEWDQWKTAFIQTCAINEWDAARSRRELLAAMKGDAFYQVRGIPLDDQPGPNGQVAPVQDMLDLYQERFVPESSVNLARELFFAARQKTDETNNQFHNRVRYLWQAAHPGRQPGDIQADRNAREVFLMGINHPEVREKSAFQHPEDYDTALTFVNDNEATLRSLKKRNPFFKKPYVHAMRGNSGNTRGNRGSTSSIHGVRGGVGKASSSRGPRCYGCGQYGHIRRNCDQPAQATSGTSGNNSSRGSSGRGTGSRRGRGRGGRQSGPNRSSTPYLAAMTNNTLADDNPNVTPDGSDEEAEQTAGSGN